MVNFKSFLDEGKNDKGIFHVVFMAGGPGSGKSYIIDVLGLKHLNYKIINSDQALKQAMKNSLLDLSMPDGEAYAKDIVRGLSKKVTMKQKGHAINGRLGIVIDGTGGKYSAIERMRNEFIELGYECAMVFVDTDIDTAQERNIARLEKGDRKIPAKLVDKIWGSVQKNKTKFKGLFKKDFYIIDNSKNSDMADVSKAKSKIASWTSKLPNNPQVKAWMDIN